MSLTHYMLSAWWINLLVVLGHYVIRSETIEHVLVMTTNLMNLGYIFAIQRPNNPPGILSTLTHLVRLVTWTHLWLAWSLAL